MSVPLPLAVLASSLLAVVLAMALFRDRPASRRLFLIALVLMFFLVPFVCLIAGLQFEIGVQGWSRPVISFAAVDSLTLFLGASGSLLVMLQLLIVFRARRRLGRLPIARDNRVNELIGEIGSSLRVQDPVEVRLGASSCSSSFAGKLIVLPAASREWQPETLQAVVAHELVHLSRRDDVWLLLTRLVMVFFWWLPWLRLLPGLLERAIEESCDDLAAYLVQSEHGYLHGVFAAAVGPVTRAGTVRAGGGDVADRFRRFSSYRDQQVDSRGLYWASLGLLAGMVLVWTIRIVPVAEPLSDGVRIVGTARGGGDRTVSVQLGVPPVQLHDDATRTDPPSSGHDPP